VQFAFIAIVDVRIPLAPAEHSSGPFSIELAFRRGARYHQSGEGEGVAVDLPAGRQAMRRDMGDDH